VAAADDLSLARELADSADAITLARYRAADLMVETKPDATPVTEADREAERVIVEGITRGRADDAVVGEEYGASRQSEGRRRWILDPIDGTANYMRGVPVWATLIALQDGEDLSLGVVSAPALGRRWWASRGGGAFVAEAGATEARRLHVSGVRELADAQLSFAGLEQWRELGRLDDVVELVDHCWRTRSFGDFWAYMLLAEGAMDIALDPVASLWDLAAPQLIVEEAGGRFSDLGGVRRADGGDAIATNGVLHEAALAIIGR
jgi:histidinol-phosphatase